MRTRRNRWFTIVATDMFCGAFAAIVLLDTTSPKYLGLLSAPQDVRITFPKSTAFGCPEHGDGNSLVFAFTSGGDEVTTFDQEFDVTEIGDDCQIAGSVQTFSSDVQGACLLTVLPGVDLSSVRVQMAGSASYSGTPASCL